MQNLNDLKRTYDLRVIVEADLGPAKARGGRALMWRCPFHREQHGYSLAVWPDGWRCFGACQHGGDILTWLRDYRGLTFADAYAWLSGQSAAKPIYRAVRRIWTPPIAQPPSMDWQAAARQVMEGAQRLLWGRVGRQALHYLNQRGLSDRTIRKAELGFIPGYAWEWRQIGAMRVPCGILIPWWIDGEIWAIKVRRAAGSPKYVQVAGSSAHGLYNATDLKGHETVLFVEGEFDTLLAEQESGEMFGVATLGSASAALNAYWLPTLLHCKTILVAYDTDEAGKKGAARLLAATTRARSVKLPYGKDLTEFYMKGGDIHQWVVSQLNDVESSREVLPNA